MMKIIFLLITLSITYDASYGHEQQLRRNLNAEENRKLQTKVHTRKEAESVFLEEPAMETVEEKPFTREEEPSIVIDEQPQTFAGEDAPLLLAGEEASLTPQQEMIMGKNSAQQESDNNLLPEESYILPTPTAQDEFINESSAQQESDNNIIVEEKYVSSSAQDESENPNTTELTEEELMNISEKPSNAPFSAPSDKPTTGQPTTVQPTTGQPTTSNIYGNKKSKIGPWPECVGWHDEDCISYIESEVEDTLQFAVNRPNTYTVHRIYVAVDEYNVVWNTPCRG